MLGEISMRKTNIALSNSITCLVFICLTAQYCFAAEGPNQPNGGKAVEGTRRMKQERVTHVLITGEYPPFANPGILAQVVPELEADSAIWPQPVAKLTKSKVINFLPQLVAEISLSQTEYPRLSALPFLKRTNGMMEGLQKA